MSKATNLLKLQAAGFRVPTFEVIPTGVFEAFRAGLQSPPTKDRILETPLPTDLAAKILDQVRGLDAERLAVRSSMIGEDSQLHSYAGQLDSYLNVPREDQAILSAVKACWASAYGERARQYRAQNGLDHEPLRMEVIVQAMVAADVSGIVFTVDPVNHDPSHMLVSLVKGWGDALAQGAEAGESHILDRQTGAPDDDATLISREQVIEVSAVAKRIESLFGVPQDIEFALEQGTLFVLQARPITGHVATENILWDNSNITESYSGVTTPLTFSVIRQGYARVYRNFLRLMGVQHVDPVVLQHLLGLYNGQVYYQMLNWYKALSSLPAFEQNRQFMEQMIGVKQPAGRELRSQRGGRLALAAWTVRMVYLHVTSGERVAAFMRRFRGVLEAYRGQDFDDMAPQELLRAYSRLDDALIGAWQAPILADFMAMIFFGLLRRLSQKWLGPDGGLPNDLLAGEGGIESLEPVRRVQALAEIARPDQAVRSVLDLEASEALERIRTGPEFSTFRAALEEYLDLFGDRCMNELKLEEPNLRDDPRPLLRWISAALSLPAALIPNRSVRSEAEARVSKLPLGKRIIYHWVLNNARRYIGYRENMRFSRSRLYGLVRRIFRGLGRQWAARATLDKMDDIYYLTVDEISDFVYGTAVTQDLRGLAAFRRSEYRAHKQREAPPNRFETSGIPYFDRPRDLLASASAQGPELRGTGCCSGKVSAHAMVITSADGTSDLKGDILVAERTDPGWAFLFPSASGILVERGSPLSHSAIVAREMGKPIIVNIPNLTARVRTGANLEMDGGQGTVRILGE